MPYVTKEILSDIKEEAIERALSYIDDDLLLRAAESCVDYIQIILNRLNSMAQSIESPEELLDMIEEYDFETEILTCL